MRAALIAFLLLGSATASAESSAGKWLGDAVIRRASYYADVGLEGTLLASAGGDAAFAAVGIDLALGFYSDGLGEPEPTRRHLRERIIDHLLDRPRPRPMWPMLARPRLELHMGAALGLDGEHHQARLAIGSGVGPIGIGIAGAREWNEINPAWALGPELRLRHRFGPQRRSPSVGLVVRADVFVDHRDTHSDRISVGMFGMFDVM
jgi:hypothetical protein